MPMHLITPHFSLDEFACRDGSPYPREWINERLRPLCLALEALREACGGRAVTVLSGYRSPAYNAKIGGARLSQHVEGRAADVQVNGLAPSDVHRVALDLHLAGRVRLGGLGLYPSFVHVDVRPGVRLARWSGSRVES